MNSIKHYTEHSIGHSIGHPIEQTIKLSHILSNSLSNNLTVLPSDILSKLPSDILSNKLIGHLIEQYHRTAHRTFHQTLHRTFWYIILDGGHSSHTEHTFPSVADRQLMQSDGMFQNVRWTKSNAAFDQIFLGTLTDRIRRVLRMRARSCARVRVCERSVCARACANTRACARRLLRSARVVI